MAPPRTPPLNAHGTEVIWWMGFGMDGLARRLENLPLLRNRYFGHLTADRFGRFFRHILDKTFSLRPSGFLCRTPTELAPSVGVYIMEKDCEITMCALDGSSDGLVPWKSETTIYVLEKRHFLVSPDSCVQCAFGGDMRSGGCGWFCEHKARGKPVLN